MFRAKRALGIDPIRSEYRDRHGHFVKRECELHAVLVTFADTDVVELLVDEYERLTTAEKDLVKNAGVSVTITDNRDD